MSISAVIRQYQKQFALIASNLLTLLVHSNWTDRVFFTMTQMIDYNKTITLINVVICVSTVVT